MWNKITVEQYQQIHAVNSTDADDVESLLQIVSILYNKTEKEVNDLPVTTFHKLTAEITALFTGGMPERKPLKRIRIGRKWYRMDYNANKLRYGQWAEIQHFIKGDLIEKLHLVAASIAAPMKWGIFPGKNSSDQHEQVANDFLKANFLDTYNSVVFFCATLTGLNNPTRDYSPAQKSPTMNPTTTDEWMNQIRSTIGLDGSTQPQK